MMKSISNILSEILGGIDPICTTQEIAGVCSVTDRTVSNWKYANTEPTYTNIRSLSHYLISEHDYYVLAFQFMLPCSGRANGKVQDDIMNMYEAGTDLHRAFRRKDKISSEEALYRMKAELKDLEEEINHL